MKVLVGAFNWKKALLVAFSVITNFHVDLRLKLYLAASADILLTPTLILSPPPSAQMERRAIEVDTNAYKININIIHQTHHRPQHEFVLLN